MSVYDKIVSHVIVQAMKVLSRAVSLSETLYAEAQELIATDSVSFHTFHVI